ncbi:MAG: hypothetical protein GTO51_07090 [Candidatus Latescibacteria bacterium]|nr:hypothetical protein [Candidatus Latescibacterota bacterium]NIM22258.1 hypothetical protein [Candidatus Latescibacterota bacterium]NIM65737.1 hypothetical protein [Candidatus Latescibacterota bacterium]NIO02122.1 hypothetical protein [Candidatus Latescibacterota bacterium]NIO28954.1 hypothetical protein [Candidatus Latescibacterota bacterium]
MTSASSINGWPPRGGAGFTLVELAVIFVAIGLLVGIGIPSFQRYAANSRIEGSANELMMDIQHARSLAITRQQTYVIQFQANQYQVIEASTGTVIRQKSLPNRVALAATGNPQFYSWGRADPVNITLTGPYYFRILTVLPTGTVRRQ